MRGETTEAGKKTALLRFTNAHGYNFRALYTLLKKYAKLALMIRGEQGLNNDILATSVVRVVMEELRSLTTTPVLIAIDGFNAITTDMSVIKSMDTLNPVSTAARRKALANGCL